jgi:hypothetical protein
MAGRVMRTHRAFLLRHRRLPEKPDLDEAVRNLFLELSITGDPSEKTAGFGPKTRERFQPGGCKQQCDRQPLHDGLSAALRWYGGQK